MKKQNRVNYNVNIGISKRKVIKMEVFTHHPNLMLGKSQLRPQQLIQKIV